MDGYLKTQNNEHAQCPDSHSTEGKGQYKTIGSLGMVSRIGSFGLMMGVSIFMGYLLGSYIDQKLETSPWFMMLSVVLCIVAAFMNFFRHVVTLSGSTRVQKK